MKAGFQSSRNVTESRRWSQLQVNSPSRTPGGYRLEWVGEFGNLQEAVARLMVAVPLSIALIVLLLYLNFGNLRDALLAASVIPMALLGGIFALWATDTAFSVSSAIGFVALFGIAAMDGILVVSYYHLSLESGLDRASAMLQTCRTQLRPVMMTCAVACVGLVPAAFSTGIGSQVQRPLALVVVGGMHRNWSSGDRTCARRRRSCTPRRRRLAWPPPICCRR